MRGTCSSHGVKGWHVGPLMDHYMCHSIYGTKTRRWRDSDCVLFFHTILHSYTILPHKNVILAAHELAHALKNPAPQAPFYNISDSQLAAIEQLSDIFSKVVDILHQIVNPPQQRPVTKPSIIPHKVCLTMTKHITSEQTNIIEDDDGKSPTSFQ